MAHLTKMSESAVVPEQVYLQQPFELSYKAQRSTLR